MKGICVMLCLATTFCFAQTDDCDLRRDTDGIKVYVCRSGKEKFRTLRAEFILENTSIEKYLKFLFDVNEYPSWQYGMIRAERLETITEDEMIYRSEIDAPWPVENRELLLNMKVFRDGEPDQIHIVAHGIPYDRPVPEDFIRVPFFIATYTIQVINDSSLKIIYLLKIDPGGSIPAWIVNMAMAEGPYDSFRNLKKRIAEVNKAND